MSNINSDSFVRHLMYVTMTQGDISLFCDDWSLAVTVREFATSYWIVSIGLWHAWVANVSRNHIQYVLVFWGCRRRFSPVRVALVCDIYWANNCMSCQSMSRPTLKNTPQVFWPAFPRIPITNYYQTISVLCISAPSSNLICMSLTDGRSDMAPLVWNSQPYTHLVKQ